MLNANTFIVAHAMCIHPFHFLVPSGPPQNFRISEVSTNFIVLRWEPPLSEDQNGIITGYVVSVTPASSGTPYELTTSATQLVVPSLMPYSVYNFAVAAKTSVGTGPFTTTITQRLEPDGKHSIIVITKLQIILLLGS